MVARASKHLSKAARGWRAKAKGNGSPRRRTAAARDEPTRKPAPRDERRAAYREDKKGFENAAHAMAWVPLTTSFTSPVPMLFPSAPLETRGAEKTVDDSARLSAPSQHGNREHPGGSEGKNNSTTATSFRSESTLRQALHTQREKVKRLQRSHRTPGELIDAIDDLYQLEEKYREFLLTSGLDAALYDSEPQRDSKRFLADALPELRASHRHFWQKAHESTIAGIGPSELNRSLPKFDLEKHRTRNKEEAHEHWRNGGSPDDAESKRIALNHYLLHGLKLKNQYLEMRDLVQRLSQSSDPSSDKPGFFRAVVSAQVMQMKDRYIEFRANVLKSPASD